MDDYSYEIYYNESYIDERFKEIAQKILELKPKNEGIWDFKVDFIEHKKDDQK